MKQENLKRGAKTSVVIGKLVLVYTFTSITAKITPGIQGKYKRNQLKIFNRGLVYKLTPFGDKDKLGQQLDILEKKDRIYDNLLNMNSYHSDLSKEELIEYKKKLLSNLNSLNKKEKTLKKRK